MPVSRACVPLCRVYVLCTQDLKARLPASAHSLYYVDIIGNISTSAVRKTATEVRAGQHL